MNSNVSYSEILQKVYNEYRALDTSEMIHSGNTDPERRNVRRAASEKIPPINQGKRAIVDLTGGEAYHKLPSNTGNVIPVFYYQ